MKRLQDKLDLLLQKYSVGTAAELISHSTAKIANTVIPLLSHRNERQFIELKNIASNGTLQGVSVMRTARIVAKGMDLYEQLYRELDLCEYILGRRIHSIMVMENNCTLNAIATADNEIVCTIEISATLKPGETFKDKHEIISQRGIACDVVVDVQLKQNSIYLFGEHNHQFTDVDFELYGLCPQEVAVVRSAFSLAKDGCFDKNIEADCHLNQLIAAAKRSAVSGEREVM